MGSVNGEINRIAGAKAAIEGAIEYCGVDVPDNDKIETYAARIKEIPAAVFSQFHSDEAGGTDKYIKSIKQENGVITATEGELASSSSSGLMSAAQFNKLAGISDGAKPGTVTSITPGTGLTGTSSDSAITTSGTINLKTAATGEIGGIMIGYAQTGKNYPVQLSNGKAYVNVPWTDTNTTSFTIGASASDDDVIILTGTPGTNSVSYSATHAKKLVDGKSYTSGNTTTSISSGSGTIKIPQLTVDQYGHVTSAADESVTITIPTTLKNPKALSITVGNQAAVSYDGGTAKSVEISLEKLGIPNVMQYQGQTAATQTMSDGLTSATIALTTGNYTAQKGDVVIDSSSAKEYIWNGSTWELFGIDDVSSYKVKQTAVADPKTSTDKPVTAFIDTIEQDTNGVITATKREVTASALGLYERATYVNGTLYNMAGTSNSNAFTIFAPTAVGTAGYLLKSNGSGAPSWTSTLGASDSYLSTSYIGNMYANALYLKSYYPGGSGDIYISGFTTAPDSSQPVRLYTARYAIIKNNSSPSACAIYAPGGFYESSDERLKNISNPLQVNLDDIAKLRKIYYTWKDSPNSNQIGVIAQDVQKLYPELVEVDENTGLLSLAYDKLSVIALAAVDKLHEEICSLQKKNTELEDRISKLENLLLYGKEQ